MTINKYFLCTSFIFFFMLFSNSFVHSESDAENRFKVWKGFKIQIVKDMKNSEEMLNFLSVKLEIPPEELKEFLFDPDMMEQFLPKNANKVIVKKVRPPLSEITKRKKIISDICRRISLADRFEAEKKGHKKPNQMSRIELDKFLTDYENAVKCCACADYIES